MDFSFQLAYLTLQAGTANSENCGVNGLPMTPSSITILGNFKAFIEPVKHPNLVSYVDTFRLKHGLCQNCFTLLLYFF